jgi:SOS-response transcriptional repressor LexA
MPAMDWVREERQRRGWSQEELARRVGLAIRTIVNVEKGEPVSPATYRKITSTLRPEGEQQDGRDSITLRLGDHFEVIDPNPRFVKKRVVAHVAAGHGGWDDEVAEEWADVPERFVGPDDYLLRAKGESMVDEGIQDGDFVLVTRVAPNMAPTGDIVIAWLNDGLVIKRWARRHGRKVLYSANEGWGEREITPDDNFQIQGIVKYWWHPPQSRAAELSRRNRIG